LGECITSQVGEQAKDFVRRIPEEHGTLTVTAPPAPPLKMPPPLPPAELLATTHWLTATVPPPLLSMAPPFPAEELPDSVLSLIVIIPRLKMPPPWSLLELPVKVLSLRVSVP
jgi:hypothetical protein